MNELKPCPFCGSEALLQEVEVDEHYVCCKSCLATTVDTLYPEDAINLWNQRAHDYDIPAIVRQNENLKAVNRGMVQGVEAARQHVQLVLAENARLKRELNTLKNLVYGDGERDTDHVSG